LSRKKFLFKVGAYVFEVLFEEILRPFDVRLAVLDNLELLCGHFGYEFHVSEVMVIDKLP